MSVYLVWPCVPADSISRSPVPKIRSQADWLNATSLMTSSGISLPCFETRPSVDHTFGGDHVLGREPTDEASRNQDEPDEDEGPNSPQTPTEAPDGDQDDEHQGENREDRFLDDSGPMRSEFGS